MTKLSAGYQAFREPALISEPFFIDDEFSRVENRRLRYAINWSFYENTAYRQSTVHKWVKRYKTDYGLYRYIRNVYNPSYRMGEFYRSHIWGGLIDFENIEQSALPIITDNEQLLEAIAQVYTWSNWQTNKGIVTLQGSVYGDVGIKIVDDTQREKVYLETVHPAAIKEIELDPFGNVKSYTIEEMREDPNNDDKTVTYTEIVNREPNSENVRFRTLLNGQPYPWRGEEAGAEYVQPYGFVPLITIQHNNVGDEWGWAELHAAKSKIHEVDDLGSKLSDQIRKMVDAPWLFSGVPKPTNKPQVSHTQPTTADQFTENPTPGREEMPTLYGPSDAKAVPLIAPLDIEAAGSHIKEILAELERDYPELQMDIWGAGEVSGKALRVARQRVENKVVGERRPNYDNGLMRANNMAVAIGGFRGYENFEGFNLDSFDAGNLEHTIAKRPVFAVDPLDDIELKQARANVEKTESEALRWPTVYAWRQALLERGTSPDEVEAEIRQLIADRITEEDFGFMTEPESIEQ